MEVSAPTKLRSFFSFVFLPPYTDSVALALHFKLYIDQEDAKSSSFEETEFLYTPLLDANRDHDMINQMPEYLTEDITFARQNAAKFYARVVDTLTRRRPEE